MTENLSSVIDLFSTERPSVILEIPDILQVPVRLMIQLGSACFSNKHTVKVLEYSKAVYNQLLRKALPKPNYISLNI